MDGQSRVDYGVPLGILLGVGLLFLAAWATGQLGIAWTLLSAAGTFGLLAAFAVLNDWLERAGLSTTARALVNTGLAVALFAGIAVEPRTFPIAGTVALAAACLAMLADAGRG